MEKLSGPGWKHDKVKSGQNQDTTLDVVIGHKEDVLTKLENEEKRFEQKKHAIQRSLVEVEKQEVVLREQEIRQQKGELNKVNETNKGHQAKVVEQLKILQTKLEEHKMIHKQNEMKMEEEMDAMIEDMEKVKKTLKIRIDEFGEEFPSPSAPSIYLDTVDGNFGSERSLSSIKSSEESPKTFRMRLDSATLSTTSSLVVEHDGEKNVCSDEDE
eukprot:GFUD01120224.1.p1 GENE.GFUD01120224.1~~GFUD01120224.1.p1  ORF type:complete len:214 (+),score=72.69 GFUD01120224.1:3-644(+)